MLYHSVIIIAYALTAGVIAVQAPVYVEGLDPVVGYWAGGVFFLLCALVHDFIMRHVERARFQRDLQRMRSDLDMAETGLDRFDSILGRLAGKDGNMESFAGEMQILRKLLKQLSTDGKQETKEEDEEFVLLSDAEIPDEPVQAPKDSSEKQESMLPRDVEILEIVRAGLQENKVDLYLQPIVRLPQRRTLFYEAFSRIRGPRG
ncbi:MAG: hypothetical protein WD185_08815, partial [Sneathiella sp.]